MLLSCMRWDDTTIEYLIWVCVHNNYAAMPWEEKGDDRDPIMSVKYDDLQSPCREARFHGPHPHAHLSRLTFRHVLGGHFL